MELYRICWKYKNGNTGHGDYVFTYKEAIKSIERDRKQFYHIPFEPLEQDGDYTYWVEQEDNEKKRSLQRCSRIKEELLDSMWG
jgi:hypothetical protein